MDLFLDFLDLFLGDLDLDFFDLFLGDFLGDLRLSVGSSAEYSVPILIGSSSAQCFALTTLSISYAPNEVIGRIFLGSSLLSTTKIWDWWFPPLMGDRSSMPRKGGRRSGEGGVPKGEALRTKSGDCGGGGGRTSSCCDSDPTNVFNWAMLIMIPKRPMMSMFK